MRFGSRFPDGCLADSTADPGYLNLGEKLAMGMLPLVVCAALEFHNINFPALALPQDPGADTAAGQQWVAHFDARSLADQQNLIELDTGALVGLEFFQPEALTFTGPVLFAARAKNRVHRYLLHNASRK